MTYVVNGIPDIGVVFDCDGTLLDSMGMWHSLDDRLAARAGVVFTKEDRDFMTCSTIPECSRYMHERYGIGASAEEVEKDIENEITDFYANDVCVRPGAFEFVRGLKALGIPMAVASSTPSSYLSVGLESTGLAPYMKAIVSVDDVGHSKREPHVYDEARRALGTARINTWGFEDALYAIDTLKGAGYKTFAVYDTDIAGTACDLKRSADAFVTSFEGISADGFLKIAEAASRA